MEVGSGTRPRKPSRKMRDVYDTNLEVESNPVMERAKKVQASLNPEFPSFIKLMVCSNVTKGFILRLPSKFAVKHMPKQDQSIVLVGENGERHLVNYLARSFIFSGGWIKYSHKLKLREGDVAVFQKVSPSQFKVYTVRKNDDLDGVIDLEDLNANVKEKNINLDARRSKRSRTCKKVKGNLQREIIHVDDQIEEGTSFQVAKDEAETSTKNNLIKINPFVDYKSFKITLNGLSLDSELSESVRFKYYELCVSQKSYLHESLKIHNPRLAVEMILETVTIADAIQGCGISTSQDDFTIWDTTLEGFGLLGMEVDFLRSRVNQLMRLAIQWGGRVNFRRYDEAKLELSRLEKDIMAYETMMNRLNDAKSVLQEEDIMPFETSLNQRKDSKIVLQSEIDSLNANRHEYELMFEEIARAPW